MQRALGTFTDVRLFCVYALCERGGLRLLAVRALACRARVSMGSWITRTVRALLCAEGRRLSLEHSSYIEHYSSSTLSVWEWESGGDGGELRSAHWPLLYCVPKIEFTPGAMTVT